MEREDDESIMTERTQFWRALLVLGRVSNLPTVWSNCLAGWLLGGGGSGWSLFDLCAGTTLLYVGGMYLNDAVDVEFDRQHRQERPIPAGHVNALTVWWFAIVLLGGGLLLLMPLGYPTAVLAVLLSGTIVVYDIVHKWVAFAPVLMAGCRFWLFLVAASVGMDGVTGYSVWCALVLAAYVVGLSYIARRESLNSAVAWWPMLALAAPAVLALLVDNADFRGRGIGLSVLLLAWVIQCIRHTFWMGERNVGRTVSGLLAGIVLVDLLAVAGGSTVTGIIFAALFGLALLFQRYVPAT